jgi:carboxyl-terminal processing protease
MRALILSLLLAAAPAAEPAAPFDAAAAFAAFEQTLREGYAYLDRPGLDLEVWLTATRAAATATGDAAAFRAVVNRAVAALTDPHLLLMPLSDEDANVWPTAGDLAIACHDARYHIADVRAGSAADRAGLRPGDQLQTVDGAPVGAAVDAWLAPFVAAPTDHQRGYVATLLANGRRVGPRRLGLSGGEVELPNPREFAAEVAARPPLSVREEGGAVVLRVENALGRRETIAAFDEALAAHIDARGVILDLRNTPSGGNTDVARAIIGHFLDEPAPYQVHEIPAIERATSVPRRFVEYAMPRAPRYRGPLAVLGGRWTGSMGEGLVIGLDAAGARTFASDMGDLLGALHVVELPEAEGSLELGMEALFHVQGTPRADYVADVPLPSADRDAEGGDPALRAALGWLARGARPRR